MTKQDYVRIAACIATRYERLANAEARGGDIALARITLDTLADSIADICFIDNPHFDRARFLKACGTID